MKPQTQNRILVLGYGNPGRQDDGLGPAVAEAVEKMALPGVTADADYQLNIEDGAVLADYQTVVFADASKTGAEPFEWRRLSAANAISFTTHAVDAESVLAICAEHFGLSPAAWLLGIRGYEFEFEEGMSGRAEQNLSKALGFLQAKLESWKE